jgi:Cof subfamily protein (haloacid dehalogenase superfamily)
VTDLDGTLVVNRQIAPEAVAAIRRYQAAGGRLTVATGRGYPATKYLLDTLGVRDPIIVCNGMRVVDPATHEVLMDLTLEVPAARTLIEAYTAAGADLVVYLGDESVVARRTPVIREYEAYYGITARVEPDLVRLAGLHPTKLLLIGDVAASARIWETVRNQVDGVETVLSGSIHFELVPAGVSKATGLKRVAAHLGVGLESVLAIGDHMNDIAMLQTAGMGAAVANATPAVRQAARFVSAGDAGLGVAEILERFCS